MPPPPERILLFRSGRHLRTAMTALQAASPNCQITVVATPAGRSALDDADVPDDRRVIYDRTPLFQPLAFAASRAAARVLTQRYDRVCVLWNDPDGSGQANVDRTAMFVSPAGFTAITADGQLIERRTWPVVRREAARALRSVALVAGLALLVFVPAHLLRRCRK